MKPLTPGERSQSMTSGFCEDTIDTEFIQVTGTDDHPAGTSQPEVRLSGSQIVRILYSPTLQQFCTPIHPKVHLVLQDMPTEDKYGSSIWSIVTPRGTGRYIAGWYNSGGSHMFVSRGLGWLRLRCASCAPPRLHHSLHTVISLEYPSVCPQKTPWRLLQ